jgi:bifunctional enzyme CysN/CysC
MATGASTSDLAVILVDARAGILPQTMRHAGICSLLGIRDVVLAVNKIDLVGFDPAVVERLVADFLSFAARLDFASVTAIPLSARYGDNVTERSARTPWFAGPSLLDHLEAVRVTDTRKAGPLRIPVQWVNRPDPDFRGFAGTIVSGAVSVGDPVALAHSGRRTRVERIIGSAGDATRAAAGEVVTVIVTDDVDIGRGEVLAAPDSPPRLADQLAAHVIWMAEEPLLPGRQYLMRIGTRHVRASVTAIRHKLDIETLNHLSADRVACNEIAVCNIATDQAVAFDRYRDNRTTGSFILIDRYSNETVGAGMIDHELMRAGNLHEQKVTVDKAARTRLTRQKPAILWFTGLSGAGKSTIADLVERRLYEEGHLSYLLDGDNIRLRLNRDLGFTEADRVENIRRVGEVARLFVDAGLIVLCSFISPFAAERQGVRELVGPDEFFEIFVDAPLETCIARDPKQLYAKARDGRARNVTGIDSPYEPPSAPDLHLRTAGTDAAPLAEEVLTLLRERHVI